MQAVLAERHQPRFHIEVGAKLVPADLGVGPHYQVGAGAVGTGRLLPLAPMPLHHQAPEHAALAGARGGGAHGGTGIRGMPQLRQHPQATLLQFGGLGVFILINHVFLGALLHQPPGLGFHPGAHKGGHVEPGVAVEH